MPWKSRNTITYQKEDNQVLQTGKSITAKEVPMEFPNGGKLILSVSKVPLFDDKSNIIGILGIYIDITNLKQKEKDLKISKQKADMANQAKSKFIANMSHDIRTPLTGIVGLSNILFDSVVEDEAKEYAKMLNLSGEQLLSLLNSILDIVSSESIDQDKIEMSSFNLAELLQNIFELELPALKLKNLDLKLEIDEDVPRYIKTNEEKLYRILLNLLSNSIKFTKKGSIKIHVSNYRSNNKNCLCIRALA